MMKRNIGLHTSADDAKKNILKYLSQHCTDASSLAAKSTIGYAAYPGYNFNRPQGAAFAVAKIVRALETDGLIRFECYSKPFFRRGHYITAKGMSALAAMKEQKAECSACGSTEYEGELKACTYCDGTKCSMCDTGDDCACLACEAHD
jgi:hypothetical protein